NCLAVGVFHAGRVKGIGHEYDNLALAMRAEAPFAGVLVFDFKYMPVGALNLDAHIRKPPACALETGNPAGGDVSAIVPLLVPQERWRLLSRGLLQAYRARVGESTKDRAVRG